MLQRFSPKMFSYEQEYLKPRSVYLKRNYYLENKAMINAIKPCNYLLNFPENLFKELMCFSLEENLRVDNLHMMSQVNDMD